MEARGSSRLTDEQAAWYAARYGHGFRLVQDQPGRLPRRLRRVQAKKLSRDDLELNRLFQQRNRP